MGYDTETREDENEFLRRAKDTNERETSFARLLSRLTRTLDMDDDTEFYIPTEKDLSGTVFADPTFFRFFPVLNHLTVMRYFEASPFYEQSYNLNSRM